MMTFLGRRSGIAVEIAGLQVRLHPAFCTQNWETIEADSYRAFAAAVHPGDIIFDVGAHIGTYSIIALKRAGENGRVVAYEPHDFTRGHLLEHLAWNAVTARAVVREVCCGAKTGVAEFYCKPGEAEGMNGLVPVPGFESLEATVVTLDSEARALQLIPSLIKIDVEGAEWDVLKGAEGLLREHGPVLFLSLHPSALEMRNEAPNMLLRWLEERGYAHETIARDHEVHIVARKGSAA